ncbi:MAG: hypothetical protein ACTJGH_02860 [Peptoniphilaceae bacterium]
MKLFGNFFLIIIKLLALPILLILFLASLVTGILSGFSKIVLLFINIFLVIGIIGSLQYGTSMITSGLFALALFGIVGFLIDSVPMFIANVTGSLLGLMSYWF